VKSDCSVEIVMKICCMCILRMSSVKHAIRHCISSSFTTLVLYQRYFNTNYGLAVKTWSRPIALQFAVVLFLFCFPFSTLFLGSIVLKCAFCYAVINF